MAAASMVLSRRIGDKELYYTCADGDRLRTLICDRSLGPGGRFLGFSILAGGVPRRVHKSKLTQGLEAGWWELHNRPGY
jgi:hypothetical protein